MRGLTLTMMAAAAAVCLMMAPSNLVSGLPCHGGYRSGGYAQPTAVYYAAAPPASGGGNAGGGAGPAFGGAGANAGGGGANAGGMGGVAEAFMQKASKLMSG